MRTTFHAAHRNHPAALLVRRAAAPDAAASAGGAAPLVDAVPPHLQTPAQREAARQLLPQAVACWWASGHTGWTIAPVDTDAFAAAGGAVAPLTHARAGAAGAAGVAGAAASAGGAAPVAGMTDGARLPTAQELEQMMRGALLCCAVCI